MRHQHNARLPPKQLYAHGDCLVARSRLRLLWEWRPFGGFMFGGYCLGVFVLFLGGGGQCWAPVWVMFGDQLCWGNQQCVLWGLVGYYRVLNGPGVGVPVGARKTWPLNPCRSWRVLCVTCMRMCICVYVYMNCMCMCVPVPVYVCARMCV